MLEVAQGCEFLVRLLITPYTSGDIRSHADCLEWSVNVAEYTCTVYAQTHCIIVLLKDLQNNLLSVCYKPSPTHTCTHTHTLSHTHTLLLEERNSWVQNPSQSFWSSLPLVARMPSLSVEWLPHICQDKLKATETSWGVWDISILSTIKIYVVWHSFQVNDAWASVTTEMLLVVYFCPST